jgi:hypothetical protein
VEILTLEVTTWCSFFVGYGRCAPCLCCGWARSPLRSSGRRRRLMPTMRCVHAPSRAGAEVGDVWFPWTLLLCEDEGSKGDSQTDIALRSQTGHQPYVFHGVHGYGDGARSTHLCDVCQELPASWGIASSHAGESLPHTYIHICHISTYILMYMYISHHLVSSGAHACVLTNAHAGVHRARAFPLASHTIGLK